MGSIILVITTVSFLNYSRKNNDLNAEMKLGITKAQ